MYVRQVSHELIVPFSPIYQSPRGEILSHVHRRAAPLGNAR